MATNTTATATTHTGNGSTNNFAISFSFLANNEVDVTVAGDSKILDTHYTISGSTVTFTSGNTPANGAAIKFQRNTNISAKKVDFQDGSVLTETDLDNNSDQILFAQQEIINDFVKRDGSNSVTGNLVFEGSSDDANETTLAITNPTADRTITVPDITGTVVTTGDTGTVSNQMIAGDAVTNAKIADDSIDSEHYVDGSIDTQHIANENITTAKLANDAVTSAKLADNSVNSEHYVDGSIDHIHLANDIIDGDNIQDDVINSEHYVAGSIDHEHLANDIIDGDNIQDDVINSEHYVSGSIDHEHLANDIIDGDNVQDNAINNEHIAANAVRVNEIKDGEITSAKLNPSAVITASEQASATTNDTSFLTSAAADARFFNISTGDTIKDGQTFPDNDTTIATTAAINDRIIDLVDDVGGFVPIASETNFPTANPDVNNGSGTLVSIKAIGSTRTPSSGTVTIPNGAGTGNTVTITGCGSTVLTAGFGVIVETTSTLHTYAFHRLVPKATEVTTVAGKAVEIGRLGTADAVADMAILGTTDVVADMAILGTNDVVADMNTLATADIVSDMNTLAVADVISDMDTVATNVTNVNNVGGSISNVNTTAGSIANVNTVAGSITNVNNVGGSITNVNNVGNSISNVNTVASNLTNVNAFANQYRIGSSNPTTSLDTGDLFFNTSTNSLKVYTGSAWVDGVTQTGNFALKTGNTFTGNNIYNDNVKVIYGTSSDGLEIFHNASDSIINDQGTGSLKLQTGGNTKIEITSTGTSVTGNIVVSGNVDGRDVAADGTKLDGIESGATADQSASEIVGLIADQTIAPSTIDMEDNEKIKLGAGDDLELFHSGSQSEINSITGGLVIKDTGGFMRIRSDELKIQSESNENYIECDANGAVQLFHNNAVKFVTSSSGGTITGTLVADGFTGPLTGNVTGNATSADTIDVTNTPTDSSFALTFVATSGSAKSLLCDTSGILFNPFSNTLTTGTFNGSGSSLTNLNADNISSGTLASARIADDAVTTSKINANAVTTVKINDNAVTTAKIQDANVTTAKLANGAVDYGKLADGAVLTAKIADNAVTLAKIENIATSRIVGRVTSGTGDPETLTASQVRTLLNVEDGATAGGGGLVKLATRRYYGFEQTTGIGNTGFTKMTKAFVTITPSSASNYIRLGGVMNWSGSDTENQYSFRWRREISGGATTSLDSELGEGTRPAIQFRLLGNGDVATLQLQGVIDNPNTTSAVTYYIEVFVDGANQSVFLNRGQSDTNDPRHERAASYFTAEEIDNSIHTHTNTNS